MDRQQSIQASIAERYTGFTVVLLFAALRFVGLLKCNELEDQDSIGFIERAELFRSLDLSAIVDMEAAALPLYSAATAVFSLFTGDFELAARFVSLASAAAATLAIYLLASRLAGRWSGIAAAAIIALNPYLIRFSYSIVSETLYVAIFAWTLYVFVAQVRSPGWRSGLCLGLLGALAFATRFESIFLFVLLPVLQLMLLPFLHAGARRSNVGKAAIAYFCTFAVLLTPQIWRVSEKMNTFALNGRTVWQAILNTPDGRSYQEKLFSLDHDPAVTNVSFLQEHPEVLKQVTGRESLVSLLPEYARKSIFNAERLHLEQIPRLVGLPVFAFSIIGFLALIRSAHAAEAGAILAIIGLGLVAPMTNQVTLDHIALAAPPITMLAGIGLFSTFRSLTQPAERRYRLLVGSLLFGFLVSLYSLDIYRLYAKPDDANSWYDVAAIDGPAAYLRNVARSTAVPPKVIGAHTFIAYYGGASGSTAPWTDLEGLVTYMRLNQIRYLYVNKYFDQRPFIKALDTPQWHKAFALEYSGENASEGVHKIYRLKR